MNFNKKENDSNKKIPINLKRSIKIFYQYNPELINTIYNLLVYEQSILEKDEKLKKKWLDVKTIVKEVFLNDKVVNVLKLSTGAGKSATLVQYILKILRYTREFISENGEKWGIAFLGQQYKQGVNEIENQIRNFATTYPVDYLVLEGKNRICFRRYDPLIEMGYKIGLSFNYLCRNCKYYNSSCPYFCKVRKVLPPQQVNLLLTVSHQLNSFIPYWLEKLDKAIIIIDEDFEDAIKIDLKIYKNTLDQHIYFLKKIFGKENKKIYPNPDLLSGFDLLLDFLELLRKFIIEGIDYDSLKDELDFLEENLDRESIDKLNDEGWKVLKKIYNQPENKENKEKHIPFSKFYLYSIFTFIKNYAFMKKHTPTTIDEWIRKSILRLKIKKKNDEEPTQYKLGMLFYDYKSIITLLDTGKIVKLFINDATASALQLKFLFGDRLNVYEKEMISNDFTIYQLKVKQRRRNRYGRKYSYYTQSSLQRFPTLNRLKELVEWYLYAHPEIELDNHLFVSRDAKVRINLREEHPSTQLWEYIARELDGTLEHKDLFINGKEIKHWFILLKDGKEIPLEKYPLIGMNDYENFKSVIIFGSADVSDGVVTRQAVLKGTDPIKNCEESVRTKIKQAVGRILRGVEKRYGLQLNGCDLGFEGVENVKVIKMNYKEMITYFKELGNNKRGITNDFDEPLKDFLAKHDNQITIKECRELYGISYYIAKRKLDELVANKKLNIKIVGSQHQAVYYI